MTQTKLELNNKKTEALFAGRRQKLSSVSFNALHLDDTTVPLSDCQNLGVLLDRTLWKTPLVKPANRFLPALPNQLCAEVPSYGSCSGTDHLTHSVTPRLLQFSPFRSACFGSSARSLEHARLIKNKS